MAAAMAMALAAEEAAASAAAVAASAALAAGSGALVKQAQIRPPGIDVGRLASKHLTLLECWLYSACFSCHCA